MKSFIVRAISLILFGSLILFPTGIIPVSAHVADTYLNEISVFFDEDAILIDWKLTPGTILSGALIIEADKDQNQIISQEEANLFGESLFADLLVEINEDNYHFNENIVCSFPETIADFAAGEFARCTASMPNSYFPENAIIFKLTNEFEPFYSVSLYHFETKNEYHIADVTQTNFEVFGTIVHRPQYENKTSWNSDLPNLQVISTEQQSIPGTNQSINERLNQLLTDAAEKTGFGFIISAILVSILLGMLHAFTPGHGKSIVAAYMIGAKDNWMLAIALGMIVALTHTGTVILTGIFLLIGAQFFVVKNIFPILEIFSAALVLGLGLFLLIQRYRYIKKQKEKESSQKESEISQTSKNSAKIKIGEVITEEGSPHPHIGPKYNPTHKADTSKLEWRTLLALGTSGGLVPCPDAIAIFIIAAGLNLMGLGVLMIGSFSLGIAFVLVSLGFLIARGKRRLEKARFFTKAVNYAPIISAVVLVFLGGYLLFSVSQKYQTRFGSTSALSPKTTNEIAYLDIDEERRRQLFITNTQTQESKQITSLDAEITSFTLGEAENILYLSIFNYEERSSEILNLNLSSETIRSITKISNTRISNLKLTPDGSAIFFDKTNLDENSEFFSTITIWKVDLLTEALSPIFDSEAISSYHPNFSPDMEWFSYYNQSASRYHVYNLNDQSEFNYPSQMSSLIQWEPNGDNRFIASDLVEISKFYAVHSIIFEIDSGSQIDLAEISDLPIYSALWTKQQDVVITSIQFGGQKPGHYFAKMNVDTSQVVPLMERLDALPKAFALSPNEKQIVYTQFGLEESRNLTGLWIINIDDGEQIQLSETGESPQWLYWEQK